MQTVPYKNFKKYLGKIRKCLICNDDPKGIRRVLWAKDKYFKAIKCKKCQLITVDTGLNTFGLKHRQLMDQRILLIVHRFGVDRCCML